MALDPDAIKQELASLNHQRREVNERLRSMDASRGRGRGFRGRGPPGLAPFFGGRGDREPPMATRDYSRDFGGSFGSRPTREFDPLDGPPNPLDRQPPRRPFLARGPVEPEPAFDRQQPAPPRRRVLSAVVVAGEARTAHAEGGDDAYAAADAGAGAGRHGERGDERDRDHRYHSEHDHRGGRGYHDDRGARGYHDDRMQEREQGRGGGGGEGGRKRPAPEGELLEEKPELKKRNRRLFGALLGTLQKFKEEEQGQAASDLAQRRAELLQRAEAKKEEEARRLRQEARQEMHSKRLEEINRKREINMLSDIKRLELLYAEKLARHDRLSAFLKTKTGPPVYWCPKQHSHVSLGLKEQQRQELQLWKADQLQQLEAEKAELRQLFERAVQRSQGGGEGEAGHEEEEEEEMQEGEEGEANGSGGQGAGEGAAMEGVEPHRQEHGEQPAADDRYEAVPQGQAPHDDEMLEDRGADEQGGQGEGEQAPQVAAEGPSAAAGGEEEEGAVEGE